MTERFGMRWFRQGDSCVVSWIDQNWGLVLLSAAVLGSLGTVAALLVRARRIMSDITREVGRGALLWGAQGRRRSTAGSWGAAGQLVIAPDGALRFLPCSSDRKRGASTEVWAAGEARLIFGERRRDVTGLRIQVLYVEPVRGRLQEFGLAHAVGTVPDEWRH